LHSLYGVHCDGVYSVVRTCEIVIETAGECIRGYTCIHVLSDFF
jgi:hypothetical protein